MTIAEYEAWNAAHVERIPVALRIMGFVITLIAFLYTGHWG